MKFNLSTVKQIFDFAQKTYRQYQKVQDAAPSSSSRPTARKTPTHPGQNTSSNYPGDFHGSVDFSYAPSKDGDPDPGEVVWTWVPYEEDYSQGKDRPVIIIGRDGPYLLALMMTSKDHNNSSAHDSRYLDIGSGVWDRQGRPSEIKLDRVIRVSPQSMRRESASIDRATFKKIHQAFKHINR